MNITKLSKAKSEIIFPSKSKSLFIISANYTPDNLSQILLKNPSLINIKDQKNETFLSYAIKRKKEEITQIIINLPLLDITYQDSKGNSYLHLSVINQLINTTKLLIEKGIEINLQNNEGNTALHYAYNFNNIKLISILIEKNADINIKNNSGLIPEKIEKNSLNNDMYSTMSDLCYKSFYQDNNNNFLDKNISIQINNNENTNNTKLTETNKNSSFKYSLVNFSYSDDNENEINNNKNKEDINILDIIPNNNNNNEKEEISDIFNLTSSITYKQKVKNVSDINSHTIGDRYNNLILEKKDNNDLLENYDNSDDIVNLQNSYKDIKNNDIIKKNLRSKSDNIFFEYSTSISKEEKEQNNFNNNNNINNNNIKSSFNKYIDQDFIFSPFVTIKEKEKEIPIENKNNINNNTQNISNDSLYIFLSEINLSKKYYDLMNSNGFEDIQLLIEQEKICNAINDIQLKEIGILLPGDRAKILIHLEEKAGKYNFTLPKNVYYEIKNVKNILEDFNIQKIYNWLKILKVENYLENFLEGGYCSIELILMQMNCKFPINDSILKEELGILKVGHRARIMNKLVEDGKKFWNKLNNNNTIIANTQMEKNCECIVF